MTTPPFIMGARSRAALFALALTAALATPQVQATTESDGVVYDLGSESTLRNLYPDASWLPAAYAGDYTNLAETIEHYTEQSLRRDGVEAPRVDVRFVDRDSTRTVRVTIHPENEITRRYADLHPAFFDSDHAGQARAGVEACKAAKGCWDPKPRQGQPWAMFLPLGLPMATQQTVLFLDYPPIPALTGRDYLNNYTMCRWGRVMGAAGADTPTAFETIVDARPIAAPGSGESQYLPDPITRFDTNTATGADYLSPMLRLLTETDQASRPVAVFGSDARNAWARMVGRTSVDVLDAGTTHLAKDAPATPWIATNHPDVTSYNCCPGDPASRCGDSHNLVADEKKDFVAACWLITMSEKPGQSPETVRQQCENRWMNAPDDQAQQALCVQAKLDNNNPAATCRSYTDAWNYCSAHNTNACASYDCHYDLDKVSQPVPAPSERPAGWGQTCNQYR
ncbi:hypothetical protein SR882_07775 [Guyparkeria halophila]|uniref:Uncharacterized protein n=1 Tax=Guyparkeria halophila TaxID=47960 RepID=A0ABZ0YU09_9GAMM|nr:hypothetical protein [Guyparkeria halophila]WQH15661.1 hypothetical protein SR882_07775 [Guyparkeria halophila]